MGALTECQPSEQEKIHSYLGLCLSSAAVKADGFRDEWIDLHHRGTDPERVEELKHKEYRARTLVQVLKGLHSSWPQEESHKKLFYTFLLKWNISGKLLDSTSFMEAPLVLLEGWANSVNRPTEQRNPPVARLTDLLMYACSCCKSMQPIVREYRQTKGRFLWGKPQVNYYILCLKCRRVYPFKNNKESS